MSGSVRVYLRGHFQCSPDDFQAQMCDVDVSSDTLLSRINEGYTVIGAMAQTSNAMELAATDNQHTQHAIAALRSALSCHPVSLDLTGAIVASFEKELQQHAGA